MDRLSLLANEITGYVIAGGASKRFGSDKRLVEIEGIPMLERARQVLRQFTGAEPFCVGDNLEELVDDRALIIRDIQSGCGPLGGLVSILKHAPTPWCLVTAVDLPHLAPKHLELLERARREELDVITLSAAGLPEPLAAIYHRKTHDYWAERLTKGELSIVHGIPGLTWTPVLLPHGSRALDNANTPADLRPVGDDQN